MEFRLVSNHVKVIKSVDDLIAGMTLLGATISREGAEMVAREARGFAHRGPDPTYPAGRPHMADTIALQPLNQHATRVIAEGASKFEEDRGGDHAFLSRAVEVAEPQAAQRFEQLGLDVVRGIST